MFKILKEMKEELGLVEMIGAPIVATSIFLLGFAWFLFL